MQTQRLHCPHRPARTLPWLIPILKKFLESRRNRFCDGFREFLIYAGKVQRPFGGGLNLIQLIFHFPHLLPRSVQHGGRREGKTTKTKENAT